ncbi:MAG TPA: hypothetical protein VHF27_11190 [Acidimicrobiales bacterium]|nr:hypothetical protein [Acidimicrobiales bacterium]
MAGGLLLLSLAFFPWHRSLVLALVYGDPTRTALQTPNPLPGTLAFLVAVAMLAQVLMTRYGNQRVNPVLVRLQPVAGMAVFALLAWKLADDPADLSTGAFAGLPLAAVLAYGALVLAREHGSLR